MTTLTELTISAGDVRLTGDLTRAAAGKGAVVFVHGSGSSRTSPRNRAVADDLVAAGFHTLLFDLLTLGEAGHRAYVFDIDLLAHRLISVTRWLRQQDGLRAAPLGYFGASTGAAAALMAAASPDVAVGAVVSRGGRPDLAGTLLRRVTAPTLLIVGGRDAGVLELNESALEQLAGAKKIAVVHGATHLFEEPGALEQVSALAAAWFTEHLAGASP